MPTPLSRLPKNLTPATGNSLMELEEQLEALHKGRDGGFVVVTNGPIASRFNIPSGEYTYEEFMSIIEA